MGTEDSIRVRVTSLNGDEIVSLQLSPQETLATVKRRAAQVTRTSAQDLSLSLGAEVLEDSTQLGKLRPQSDELVLCLVRLCRSKLTVVFGSEDGALRSWVPPGGIRSESRGHCSAMRCLEVDAATCTGLSGGADGTLHVWDLRRFRSLTAWGLQGHKMEVRCLAVDWASQRAASAGADGMLFFWNLRQGKWSFMLKADLRCLAVDAELVVGADRAGSLQLRSWNRGEVLASVPRAGARCLALEPRSGCVLTGGDGARLQLWKPHEKEDSPLRTLQGLGGAVCKLSVDWAMRQVVSSGDDGCLWLWDLDAEEVLHRICDHGVPLQALMVDFYARKAVTVCAHGTVKVWSIESGEMQNELEPVSPACSVAFI